MTELEIVRAWRRLFMSGDGLSPDGELVLRDLEKRCGWTVADLPTDNTGAVDPLRTAAQVERRGVYLHARKRLFGDVTKLLEKEKR